MALSRPQRFSGGGHSTCKNTTGVKFVGQEGGENAKTKLKLSLLPGGRVENLVDDNDDDDDGD
eukprot:7516270-Karenia_brevis.AAC.1